MIASITKSNRTRLLTCATLTLIGIRRVGDETKRYKNSMQMQKFGLYQEIVHQPWILFMLDFIQTGVYGLHTLQVIFGAIKLQS